MAQTQYITVAELAEQSDSNVIKELGTDDPSSLAAADQTNTIAVNAIEQASAEVEMAALRGQAYTLSDLSTLKDDDSWALKGLVARLAIAYMFDRRSRSKPSAIASGFRQAQEDLRDLRNGTQIFPTSAAPGSGTPRVVVLNANQRARKDVESEGGYFPPSRTTTLT